MNCVICFEKIENNKIVKPCNCNNGYYHDKCILKWIKMKKNKDVCEICLHPYENISKRFIIKKKKIIIILLCFTSILFNIFSWMIHLSQPNTIKVVLCRDISCILSIIFTFFNIIFISISILYLFTSKLFYTSYRIKKYEDFNNDV